MFGLTLYMILVVYWFYWLNKNLEFYNKKTGETIENFNALRFVFNITLALTWMISFPVYILPLVKKQSE